MRSSLLLGVVLLFAPQQLCAWKVSAPRSALSRRAVIGGGLASLAITPLPALAKKEPQALKDSLVLILRVKEATQQETRLITTGKYKELQRLNVKRAVKFMLDNYSLQDRFIAASTFAPLDQQQLATSYAQSSVEPLIQIIEYFPQDLKANSLTSEQKTFVMSALTKTQTSIDSFLELMPSDVVASAAAQIEAENRLNEEEYQSEDGSSIINITPSAKEPAPAAPAPAPAPVDPA